MVERKICCFGPNGQTQTARLPFEPFKRQTVGWSNYCFRRISVKNNNPELVVLSCCQWSSLAASNQLSPTTRLNRPLRAIFSLVRWSDARSYQELWDVCSVFCSVFFSKQSRKLQASRTIRYLFWGLLAGWKKQTAEGRILQPDGLVDESDFYAMRCSLSTFYLMM